VDPTSGTPAAIARDPEVGRASVKNYFEGLTRGTDLYFSEVLGIHYIVDWDVRAFQKSVSFGRF
jgi:hypothetical protein